jgi:anti-sigma B factor antagonist
VARVITARFADEDNIESLGRDLFSLVDRFGARKIVLTLGNVELVTSAVLGKIISLHRRLHRAAGSLVLCDLHDEVAKTIQSSRLATYFHIQPDVERALEAIQRQSTG